MLSYLHGYHAGNEADVLKHSTLVFCLDYLKQKEKPLLCVDTHAGAGFYDLSNPSNQEWKRGIGKLRETAENPPPMLAGYLKLPEEERYPGSSVIMAAKLSRGDRLVSYELHPGEFEALKGSMEKFRGDNRPTVEVRREDGLGGLKSLLPPPSRRGLVFIDPSWEEQSEYESVPRSVSEGLKRFPEGTFIIWYPLLALPKEKNATASQRDVLFSLSNGKRCRVELYDKAAEACHSSEVLRSGETIHSRSPRGMYGSGLVIYNPPWTLFSALEEALPGLALSLFNDEKGWRLDREE